jgi:hypothetical protein
MFNLVNIQIDGFLDGFMVVDSPGGVVERLMSNRPAYDFRIDCNPERFLQSWEIREMQPVLLVRFAGRWNAQELAYAAGPRGEKGDPPSVPITPTEICRVFAGPSCGPYRNTPSLG